MNIALILIYGIIGAGLGYTLAIFLNKITKSLFGDTVYAKAISYSLLLLGVIFYVGSYSQTTQQADRSLAAILEKIKPGHNAAGSDVTIVTEQSI